MRVAIITESFLPRVNGVTNSVCRVVDELGARGHDVMVVAPAPGPSEYAGLPVETVPSVSLPGYTDFPVGLATRRRIEAALRRFRPDVVHLASPTVLGAVGVRAAERLGIPSVAVFQTDLAGFARGYRLWRAIGDDVVWAWLRRIHEHADRTLAPSSATIQQLAARGFPRLARWGRGVDLDRFHPRHRDDELRRRLAPRGEVLVGYVGRLAAEKQVRRLIALRSMPGIRLVVIGSGPSEAGLRRSLPEAAFLGFRTGEDLSRAYASMDIFVHTGPDETFCQTVQEALASGVPVVAPASGGPLDLIDPGGTGYVVGLDDDRHLRRAVALLVTNPAARVRMARAARASVLERSWSAVVDDLLGHYAEVAAVRRTAGPRHVTQMITLSGPLGPLPGLGTW